MEQGDNGSRENPVKVPTVAAAARELVDADGLDIREVAVSLL